MPPRRAFLSTASASSLADQGPLDVALFPSAVGGRVLLGGYSGGASAVVVDGTGLVASRVQATTVSSHTTSTSELVLAPASAYGSGATTSYPSAYVASNLAAEALRVARETSNVLSASLSSVETTSWASNAVGRADSNATSALGIATSAGIAALSSSNAAAAALHTSLATSNSVYYAVQQLASAAEWQAAAAVDVARLSNVSFSTSNLAFSLLEPQVSRLASGAVWASNVAAPLQGRVAEALVLATTASREARSAFLTATEANGAVASNVAAVSAALMDAVTRDLDSVSATSVFAASNASGAVLEVRRLSEVVHGVRAESAHGSNAAGIALEVASRVSSEAASRVEALEGDVVDLRRTALSAEAGGSVRSNIDFGNVASIVSIATVGIGTNSPEYPVHVMSVAPGTSTSMWLAGDIQTLSDARDKSDISRICDPISRLERISGYTYRVGNQQPRVAGVLAQEVVEVFPEAVQTNHAMDGKLSVSYHALIPLLIEAINELTKKVDALSEQVAASSSSRTVGG